MKIFKNLSLKKILLSILTTVFLGTAAIGGVLSGNTAEAFSDDPSSDASIYIDNPLFNFQTNNYDEEALDQLANLILSQQSDYSQSQPKKIGNLISYINSNARTHGLPVNNKQISLKLGKYQFDSLNDEEHALVWMPAYMSTTADGGSAVLTLYLSTVNGARSRNEYAPFSANMKLLTNSTTIGANPSNMYGSSCIRADSRGGLGNGGTYATYGSSASAQEAAVPDYTSCHKYLDFLQYTYKNDDGVTETRKGLLYDDIVSPADLKWQSEENYATAIGSTVGTIYDVDGVTQYAVPADWENYCWPNDAYGTPNAGSFYKENQFDYGGKASKKLYDAWKNDKVWLPSVTEVGTADGSNGLWKLSNSQRAMFFNTNPAVAQQAVPTAWLRTACTAYNDCADGYSVAHVFVVQEDGSIGIRRLNDANAMTMALRPAIHLNLTAAQKKTTPPVNLGDTVYATYNGEQHRLDSQKVTLTPEQSAWFVKDKMNVRFAYDKAMTKLANPINSGEYYMQVTLNPGSNLYFINPSEDNENVKVVKFIVQKAKVGIKWKMDGNIPVGVEFAPGTKFYDRDINSGSVPELGIRFKDYNNNKLYETTYDELLRGNYTAQAYIVNPDLYNYEISGELGDGVQINDWFAVGRRVVKMPRITGAGEGAPNPSNGNILTYKMTYKGNQYIQVENADKYLLVSVTSKNGTIECFNEIQTVEVNGQNREFPVVSENGTLTYKITDVDTYTFNFEFPDNTRFTWEGEYDFRGNEGRDDGADWSTKYLVIDLQRSEVTAEFAGLPNEWSTIHIQSFTVELYGIYEHIDGVEIPLTVRYMNDKSGDITTLTATDGVYTLANLTEGTYTIYAGFVSNDAYDKLYYFASGNKTQTFKVIQAVSQFKDDLVNWQYTHKGETKAAGKFNEHNTYELAFEFDYDGDDYIFSLTTNENVLRDVYYVKAVYSGDKFVRNAGKYSITVAIRAYYKNVQVEEKSYTLYFNINPATYKNLSELKWDYDPDSPFTFDGKDHKVRITPESLTLLPGLTAVYSTDGNRIDAGSYKTTVSFLISGEHAGNYIIPDAGNENSYEGTFAFSCDWVIEKAKLTVEWLTPEENSGVFFAPVLKQCGEYVTYAYERKQADNTWASVTVLKAEGSAETFRAIAVLRPEFTENYELVNNEPCEFTVESGKIAVTVHFEANGQICRDGDQFVYTGDPVAMEVKTDGAGTVNEGYTVKYYRLGAGNTRTELDSAPYDVGNYVAAVTARYGAGTYISDECTSEVTFEIIKADYDLKEIYWIYDHGTTVIAASYDSEQGKFVDSQGREVEFVFEYDGTAHTLSIECQQEFRHKEDAPTVKTLIGTTQINAGTYEAEAVFDYNEARFNAIALPKLTWTVTKQKIDYNKVRWGYINKDGEEKAFDFDKDSFRYTRDASGPVGYTVALIGLPKEVGALLTYTTKCLSVAGATPVPGNTCAAVGEYVTSFTVSGKWSDPDGNYEDFDSATFPLTIPASQTWEIERRELSVLDYKGDWTTFDVRTHDVLELCNIPYTELNYLKIEITFIDGSLTVFNEYEGYEGVANALFHAGTYEIRLYEKVTKYNNGAEVEDLQIRDVLTLEIKKAELEVEWDTKGAYPIAVAKNVLASDMIITVYKRSNGAEVPLAYVKSTNGEETFTATVDISDDYRYDIVLKMATGHSDSMDFNYLPFTPTPGVMQLDLPAIMVDEMRYTGEPLTFTIGGWDSVYAHYCYVASGSLTQTEKGEYSVVIRFFKDADAYWKSATQSTGEYNRDSVTLTFTILPPEEWPLDYPKLVENRVEWTGDDIQFVIVNWIGYSKYLTYEVFKDGESYGDNLKFKHGGIYTVVFTFPDGSIGYWKENPDGKHSEYRLQFEIYGDPEAPTKPIDPNDPPVPIQKPTLDNEELEWTGKTLQFGVKNWVTIYSKYLDISCDDPSVEIDLKSGILKVSDIGEYTVTLTFKEDAHACWTLPEGSTDAVNLKFSVKGSANPNIVIKPSIKTVSKQWTGKDVYFELSNYNPEKVKVIGYDVFRDENGKYYINAGKAIGEYSVTFRLLGEGLSWHDGTTDDYATNFEIIKLSIQDIEIGDDGKPVVKDKNGNKVDVDLSGLVDVKYYDKDGNEVDYKDLKPGEKYTVKLVVKDPADFDKHIDNSSHVQDLITDKNNKGENGGFVINNYQPTQSGNEGDGEKEGGFNPLWWIAIVAGILAVIAIIGLIIGLATRNNNGGYDDGYGYDDYGDDYDDYDDDYDDDDYDDDDYYDDY